MTSVRPLLVAGNGKLGGGIATWSLPAVTTCPGRSAVCQRVCYAREGRFRFPAVQERLDWNYEQSLLPDFGDRVVDEIRRKGIVPVLRLHISGDFYAADYAAKWLHVMRTNRRTRYYFYTRSWRVGEVAAVLEEMAALRVCRAWYSIDAATGVPERVPRGVRLAYLQADGESPPELTDLMFRVRRLRREQPRRMGLPLVCPHETPQGRAQEVNCSNCQNCWR